MEKGERNVANEDASRQKKVSPKKPTKPKNSRVTVTTSLSKPSSASSVPAQPVQPAHYTSTSPPHYGSGFTNRDERTERERDSD